MVVLVPMRMSMPIPFQSLSHTPTLPSAPPQNPPPPPAPSPGLRPPFPAPTPPPPPAPPGDRN
ncbi:unnamed protein product, partial [Tilletia controversa]